MSHQVWQWAQRFWRSPAGRLGSVFTTALMLLALLAPVLRPYDPNQDPDYLARLQPPSFVHWLGTDGLGRDVLTLVWHGLQTSLVISLSAVGLGVAVGTALGLLAGYFRDRVDPVIGWLTNVLLAFPPILLAIAVVTIAGRSLASVMVAIGLVQIPIYIRLTRSLVFSLREQAYILAAQALGAHPAGIIGYHLLPAVLPAIAVQATLSLGTATLESAGLGFLGLGAQPPTPELGTMIADAFQGGYSLSSPWTMIFPGLLITLMVLAFNLLGDGLRDFFDPRSQKP